MKIGFIGITNSGKTTIFNALTGQNHEMSLYTNADQEPSQAIIDVQDERVAALTAQYQPKKTTFATVELMDFPGFGESGSGDNIPPATYADIKNLDALALVLRNFDNDLMGVRNPLGDLQTLEEELILSDMILIEKRLGKIEAAFNRGKKTSDLVKERAVLQFLHNQLEENHKLGDIALSDEDNKRIRGFQFLTRKPILIILNSDEINFGQDTDVYKILEEKNKVLEFAGKFEMELSQLDDNDEIQLFMADIGITESSGHRLTNYAYEVLGYISFFTVGADEVRAWTILAATQAVDAAAVIHNDISRGFIRAECFSYDDLITYGDEKSVKQNGKARLEGKSYTVQDGDIISFRFNV